VVSCDNIQGNGHVARTAVLGFAERRDPDLAAWIAEHVAFPNSMVDRITPVTTAETRAWVLAEYGIEDRWPVRSESFAQWVLEDAFPGGRPPLELVGVQMVDDVEPYELMKLRLLNASHQAMGYLGLLAGDQWAHEVGQDPLFAGFLLDYMRREAIPTLLPVPGIDLDAYCRELIERFGNEAVRDTLARLAVGGSDRFPKFLLPVLRRQLETGGEIRRGALVLAAWSRFLEGRAENGDPTPIVDQRATELIAACRRSAPNRGPSWTTGPSSGTSGPTRACATPSSPAAPRSSSAGRGQQSRRSPPPERRTPPAPETIPEPRQTGLRPGSSRPPAMPTALGSPPYGTQNGAARRWSRATGRTGWATLRH
jgi:mannitol-1-phosphate/altronate dehydrogenase